MTKLFDLINYPLSYVLRYLSNLFGGNFAVSVLVFTLLANIVLLPLSIKSQKSTVQQTRIKPKLDELKKRYGDDKKKLAEAQQKLYQDEGISMSGGCLPMVFRLVFMISIYNLINRPLTYLMNIDSKVITAAQKFLDIKTSGTGAELEIIGRANELTSSKFDAIRNGLKTIDFNLFGIDLTATPKFSFDFSQAQLIWLIPLGAFLAQIITSIISMAIQKKNNPDAPSMATMMLTMPLITLFIGFRLPGGVGFYWICSSLIGGLIQSAIQILYGPQRMLANERAKELKKQIEFEAKQIAKSNDSKNILNGEEIK